MGFKEEIQKLSIQINERRTLITNEEMTKQALIIPFLQVLGFDVFNPLEVKPEFFADFEGVKKGEKVDYAIFKGDEPIMFIEAKSADAVLVNHDAQLSRYFNAVPNVKLGVITNGLEYRFFTDLNRVNFMDDSPFLSINLANLKDGDIETLARFKKDTFARENLSEFAEELVYTSAINDSLKYQFKNPTDEFVRYLLKEVGVTRVMAKDIERFRPIVKKGISNAILDIVSQGLIQQEQPQSQAVETTTSEASDIADTITDSVDEDQPPEPTEEQKRGYEIVRVLLQKAGRDIQELQNKNTYSYYSINYQNTRKWFIRFMFGNDNKNILLKLNPDIVASLTEGFRSESAPKGLGVSRVYINNVDDLVKLDKLLVACYDDVSQKT